VEYVLENGRNLVNKFKEFEIFLRICKSSNLCLKEINLFLAIVEWHQTHLELNDNTSDLFEAVRYPLISKLDLISKVRPTGMANPDLYMAALEFHHFPSMYNGPEIQTLKRKYQYHSELKFTNRTPGNTQMTLSPDTEGVAIAKNSGGNWDSLCLAQLHITEKYPLHFKLILKCCGSYHQGIKVGLRTCPSTNIAPYHSNGIDMVGINTDEGMNGKVTVSGNYITISLGEKIKHVLKTNYEIYLCINMYSTGTVQLLEM